MVTTTGPRAAGLYFVDALGAASFDSIEPLLSAEVRFRALLPSGVRECTGRIPTADYFRAWFGPIRIDRLQPCDGKPYPFKETTRCEVVESTVGVPVVDKVPIRYMLELQNNTGPCRCEQQGFYTVDGEGRIATLDVVCSGILRVPATP
jgi:hypothetical protein